MSAGSWKAALTYLPWLCQKTMRINILLAAKKKPQNKNQKTQNPNPQKHCKNSTSSNHLKIDVM